MKKVPLLYVLAVLVIILPFAHAQETSWYTSNSSASIFYISNADELKGLAQLVNDGTATFSGKTIILENDIALNDTTDLEDWEDTQPENPWTAIGTSCSYSFQGTFDGKGNVISGIYINNESNCQGLFGYVGSDGTIKNLGIEASYVKGGSNVGGLVGASDGTVSNSYSTGAVSGSSDVGGLVGYLNGNGTVSNSYSTGAVSGTGGSVGGLVGSNSYGGTVSNSYSTGAVSGSSGVGGLVGSKFGGTVSNSYSTGAVSGSSLVGGLVGYQFGTVSNSYAAGAVSGNENVGGLVGYQFGGTVSNSYASGAVSGNEHVGGLVGSGSSTVSNSYYDRNTSGQSDAGKGEGKTTLQMKTQSTYVGWDFDYIWAIIPSLNNGYPFLQSGNALDLQIDPIASQIYTGLQIKPEPGVKNASGDELTAGEDFRYEYGANTSVQYGGSVAIVGLKPEYNGVKVVYFEIIPVSVIDAYWFPACGTSFTYSGEPLPIQLSASNGETLVLDGDIPVDANNYTLVARLQEENDETLLRNNTCTYIITPKQLEVKWFAQREFVYNKMVQYPEASLHDGETEIPLTVSPVHSSAGVYSGQIAPRASITDETLGRNYTLLNNTVDYEITKKDLSSRFFVATPAEDFDANQDTVWVPTEIFRDSVLLRSTLLSLLGYDGFATDDKGESDNASVLRGEPAVEISYSSASVSLSALFRRVETTQTATAAINAEEVSADNYSVLSRNIVVMEAISEDDNAAKIYCLISTGCTQFSEAVCSAIGGFEVESCDVSAACVISSIIPCIENISLKTCFEAGGTAFATSEGVVELCSDIETPVRQPLLSSAAPFRAWQTMSGALNVDLGYTPASPVLLEVRDLKGKLVAAENVGTRFASVKVNAASGVYVLKAGNRNAVAVVK